MLRDLHPYDGSTFRFSHDDQDPLEGVAVVTSLAIALPRPRFDGRALRSRLGYVAPHDRWAVIWETEGWTNMLGFAQG